MRMPKIVLKATALAAVLVICSSVVSATAAPPTEAADRAPGVRSERSVPGHLVPVAPLPRNEMATRSVGEPRPAWPAAAMSEVDLAAGGPTDAVSVAAPAQRSAAPAGKVSVETLGQDVSGKAGIAGVLLRVADAGGAAGQKVAVRVDYRGFGHAYGSDYGSRLRLVRYPACVLTTPEKPECRNGSALASTNNVRKRTVSAEITVPAARSADTVLAAEASVSGSGGSYAATDLAPSGSWVAGGSSGELGYSVPLTMPAAPGGPAPQLAFGYSSGSVDGRTSATNAQASWVGDGWDLTAGGFIERRYTACAEDEGGNQGSLRTGDLCWDGEHYTMSLAGSSGKLIKDRNTGALRPEVDDGSRIEHVGDAVDGWNNDESWKVTTPDGTQYFLGLNRLSGWAGGNPETRSVFTVPVYGNHGGEPCNRSTFADSSCTQAYRWNVDLVIDPLGNAMTFYYDHEINHYKRGGLQGVNTPYVAAGRVARIEYGLRRDGLFAQPPARVVFETAERCLPNGAITCDPGQLNQDTASNWPDVPFDRICAAGEDCVSRYSPAFFTRKRLTRVVTQFLDAGTHRDVDSWNLRHEFPPTGDGLPKSLWLAGITRIGHVGGTASLPEQQFLGTAMDNRVDSSDDNLLPITRYRLTRIIGEAGAVTEVRYADHECPSGSRIPESNTMRCYPMFWAPEGAPEPRQDWFHKYVVSDVTEDARTAGPSMTKTHYDYLEGGAWHYDDNDQEDADKRTWSEWRGYGRVRTVRGDPGAPRVTTETLYLRGMDGDTLPGGGARDVWVTDGDGGRVEDRDPLRGFVRETVLLGGGRPVSAEVGEPHLIETANDGTKTANMVRQGAKAVRTLQEDGSWRRTRSSTTFTAFGQPETVDNEGDIAVAGDESCTQTTYLRNDAAWMLVYTSRVRSIAKRCNALPGAEADVLSDVVSAYDNQAPGVAPTRGVVTETKRWTGGTNYQLVSTDKTDDYGRVIESTDVERKTTTATYTPTTGTPNKVVIRNRVGWTTESTMDPARGLPLTEIGLNGERAELEYDPLGRLVKVWAPGRARSKTPTTEYSYEYRVDAPTVVTTKTLKENETYAVSYDLFDGLLRPRQSQSPGSTGGRVVTDTFYNSLGQTFKVNGGYYNQNQPSNALWGVFDWDVPNQTVTEYDDLGRPVETILKRLNQELWRTKTRFAGDTTYTTPPPGGTPTAVVKDALGRIVERRQYHARSDSGIYGATATFDAMTYGYDTKGRLAKVADVLGNKWTYEYDTLGRKKADTDPDSGRATFTYNALDQLESTTDARGKTLAYTYDALGRRTAILEGSVSGPKLTEWTYDTLRKGLPTSATRFAGGQAYVQRVDRYDDLNRPTNVSVVVPPREGALAKTYAYQYSYSTVTGQLRQEVLPAVGSLPTENVVHTYNDLGLPDTTGGLNTYASEQLYSPFGETLRVTLGASPNKVWVKNDLQEGTRRVDNVEVRRDTSTQPQVANRAYSYDPAGNITRIANLPIDGPADTQCFSYDTLRRLTSAWTPKSGDCAATKSVANLSGAAPYWYDFTFDKIGNRKTQVQHTGSGDVTETYTVPASGPGAVRPHTVSSLTRVGPTGTARDEFTYDEAGNTRTRTIGGNTQTLDWSAEGRVSKVTEANGQASEYLYDANGNRLIKREPSGTTLYLPGQEVSLPAGSSTPTGKRYYSHGGATVAMRTSQGLSWILGDHHGTDEVAIWADNLFVSRRYSDPYGNSRGTTPGWWPDDKGLVGGTKDATGLTSIGAREYDSKTGRFVSVDPLVDFAEPQQAHGYSYANGNPATLSDPSGLRPAGCEEFHLNCRTDSGYMSPDPEDQARHAGHQQRMVEEAQRNWHAGKAANDSQDRACSDLGMSKSACKQMQDDASSQKGFWDVMREELPDIIGDLTGLTDLRDCFTKFDLWACASIVPWGRILRLIRSAGKIFNAVRKALAWESRVADAVAKMNRWRARLEDHLRQGMKKVDALMDDWRKSRPPDKAPDACPVHSFPPGTQVLLADGTSKPIDQVKLGDVVLTTDPDTGRTEPHKVVATWVHDNEPQRTEVTVDIDGPAGTATATISATDWHPVWVPDLKAWVPIADLQAGSWLRTSAGTWVQATTVRHYTGTGQVYDLTVEGVHTYHVLAGTTPILVHNCSDAPSSDIPRVHTAGGPKARPGRDIDIDDAGFVHPPSQEALASLDVQGLSTYDTVENLAAAGLTGQVRTPTKVLPDGLGIIADGVEVGGLQPRGHHTIFPARRMTYDEYHGLYTSMTWINVGVRLR